MNPTQWRLRLRGCVGFVTVPKTAFVLSDGSVVHSDSSLNFSGQQYLRISSEEKRMVIRVCATRMTIPLVLADLIYFFAKLSLRLTVRLKTGASVVE